jgi:LacI family transcriptional regulator
MQKRAKMPATVREVAFRAGVSAMTVSRVINDRAGVGAETRQRVQKAISELDYNPNRIARSLISNKTNTVGLIVPDVSNPFFAPLLKGAEMAARRAGYRLLVCNSEGDLRLEREYVEDLVSHRVEGLLIAPANDHSKASLRPLLDAGFPLALVDRAIPGLDCDLVQSDNTAGARRLTEHLINIGHRRIAHVTESDDVSTGRERLLGYREALESAGIPFEQDLLFRTTVDRIGGYRATQEMLSLDRLPTAIFTVNNMTAVGAVQALRERGMTVPKDICLVCFDEIEHLAVLSPFLTVIDQPAETFGRLGTELLLERISGSATERSRRVVLPTNLIVRESCGKHSGVPSRGT